MAKWRANFRASHLMVLRNAVYKTMVEMRCTAVAFKFAACVGLSGGVVKYLDTDLQLNFVKYIMPSQDAFKLFSSLITIMVIFHTVQSYSRYMSGITLAYQMFSDFIDTAGFVTSFVKSSAAEPLAKDKFLNTMARLFSVLFMSCLAELETPSAHEDKSTGSTKAHTFNMVDPEGLDDATLNAIHEADNKPLVVNSKIVQLMMDATHTGVLDAPAPILSRAFQELGNGMTRFHEALKFNDAPFPLPYIVLADLLLILHSMMTPFAMAAWSSNFVSAGILSFLVCFSAWSLHNIAEELDNPFDNDDTDMDAGLLMRTFNRSMLCLLQEAATQGLPTLKQNARSLLTVSREEEDETLQSVKFVNFLELANACKEKAHTISQSLHNVARETTQIVHTVTSSMSNTLTSQRSFGHHHSADAFHRNAVSSPRSVSSPRNLLRITENEQCDPGNRNANLSRGGPQIEEVYDEERGHVPVAHVGVATSGNTTMEKVLVSSSIGACAL